jgi:hypothetical protein
MFINISDSSPGLKRIQNFADFFQGGSYIPDDFFVAAMSKTTGSIMPVGC